LFAPPVNCALSRRVVEEVCPFFLDLWIYCALRHDYKSPVPPACFLPIEATKEQVEGLWLLYILDFQRQRYVMLLHKMKVRTTHPPLLCLTTAHFF